MKTRFTLCFLLLYSAAFANTPSVKGIIRDMDSGQPLPAAVVTITFESGFDLSDTTDANGYYEIPTPGNLPPGDYGIRIDADEHYSVFGFIRIKSESVNDYKMKRKAPEEKSAVLPAPVKSSMEGIATNNLVFLIDISASMNTPEKLPLLKASLKYLVDELRSTDRIAILTFSSSVKEVLPSTPVAEKELILKTIDALDYGSTTQGGTALEMAYAATEKNFVEHGNNRIILASDGLFTSGDKDFKKMKRSISSGLEKHIALSIFCFGKNTTYVYSKLQKLAEAGKGNFALISGPEDGKLYMMEEARAVKAE